MTEDKIKEMLIDIINNGAKYECRDTSCIMSLSNITKDTCNKCKMCPGERLWRPYKLGEAIHENFEYRKVENWRVYEHNGSYFMDKELYDYKVIYGGSKENCQKVLNKYNSWVESFIRDKSSNMKKLFSEEGVSLYKTGVREGIKEFSKKLLEEVENNVEASFETTNCFVIGLLQLQDIIKDLVVFI